MITRGRIVKAIEKGLLTVGAVLMISTMAHAQNGNKKNKSETEESSSDSLLMAPLAAPTAARAAAPGGGGGGTPPPNPTGYITVSSNTCGNKTLTRSSSPPSGTVWFWQTSAGGTSMSSSGSTYTATSTRTYYIRAYKPSTDLWSTGYISKYATVNQAPSTPSTPSVSNHCTGSTLTRGTPPSGVSWYWQTSSSGTDISNSSTNYNTTGSGTRYLRARNNSTGCWSSGSASRSFAQLPAPSAPSYTLTTNTCGNKTLSANNPPHASTNLFWRWQGTNSNGYSQTPFTSHSISSSGTYYVRTYNADNGCWSSSVAVSVTINANPSTPPAPSVQNNCGNSVISYTSGQASGQNWYWQTSASGTANDPVSSTLSKTLTSGSVIYVRKKSAAGCWSTARTVNYSIKSIPGVPWDPSLNSTGCGTATVGYDFEIAENKPWYWQNSATGTANSNGELVELNLNRNFSSDGTTHVRAYQNGCWSAAKTIAYNVTELPGIASGSDNSRCEDGSITLTATPGSGGDDIKWYSTANGGTAVHTGTSYTITNLTADVTYYAATYSSATTCVDDDRIAITADWKEYPIVYNVGGGGNYCPGENGKAVTLSDSETTSTYTLYKDGISTGQLLSGTGSALNFGEQTNTGAYTIQAVRNTGCSISMSGFAVVTSNPPSIPWNPNLNSSFCGNATVGYDIEIAENRPWYWQNSATGTANSNSELVELNLTRTFSSTGTTYVRAYDSNSQCWSDALEIQHTIIPLPDTPTGDDQRRCGPGALTLSAAVGDNGNEVRWYAEATGINPPLHTGTTYPVTVSSTSTYYADSYNSNTTCFSATRTAIQAFVDIAPQILDIDATFEFCPTSETTTTISITGESGVSYQLNTGQIGQEGANNLIEWFNIPEGTYTVTGTRASCSVPMNGTLSVIPQWLPNTSFGNQTVFDNTKLDFEQLTGSDQGTWTGNGVLGNTFLAKTAGLGDHALSFSYASSGCYTSKNITITVEQLPTLKLTGYTVLRPGRNVTLTIQNGAPSFSYSWYRDKVSIDSEVVNDQLVTNTSGVYNLEVNNGMGYASSSNEIVLTDPLNQSDLNYVLAKNYKVEETVEANLPTQNSEVSTSYQYFDDLGRSIQKVNKQASPAGEDMAISVGYDQYSRQVKSYLPFTAESNGTFKSFFEEDQVNFYTARHGSNNGPKAYLETVFEDSPLNRPANTYASGQAWAKDNGSGGKPISYDYSSNESNEVLLWEIVNDKLTKASFYLAGTLYKNITIDENGKQIQEFKNRSGQQILKKVQISETDPSTDNDWLQTYYVYDEFNNLRFVLPPMAVQQYEAEGQSTDEGDQLVTTTSNYEELTTAPNAQIGFLSSAAININSGTTLESGAIIYSVDAANVTITLNQDFLAKWAFQYRYDDQQRMIEKQVPGAGIVTMVYDDRDRLVMTQDGNQRIEGNWSFTKYDYLNRPVLTGIIADSRTRIQIQDDINLNLADYSEEYTGTGTLHGYNGTGYPTAATEANLLTVTYYDNYTFTSDTHWTLGNYATEPQAKALATGSKVRVPGHGWNESITIYDSRHRVVSSISQDYLGNKDTFVNTYRNLVHARLDKTIHTHESQLTGTAVTTTVTKDYLYDHADRLLSITHQINTETPVVIVENTYNELGELITKKLNKEGAGQYSQEVDYRYNIRGWLTQINDIETPNASDYFNMQLQYDEANQYNGNIGTASWKNPFETSTNSYAYNYDPANRIKNAIYTTTASNGMNFDVSGITYDANGNIETLQRTGTHNAQAAQLFDNLDYDYVGNQLTKVTDASGKDKGFKDGANTTYEYVYDANGNLIKDLNKGIENISYNHLNLPIKIEMKADGSDRIEYIYDAAGVKLAQIVYQGNVEKNRTDYLGAFIYKSVDQEPSVLQLIQHEEGRVVYETDINGSFVEYEYQYHIKDHLGNVRATFKEDSDSEIVTAYMEDDTPTDQNGESGYFFNYENIKRVDITMLNSTPDTTIPGASHSMRLSGADDERFGLNRQLAVKPGDQIDVSVQAIYLDPAVSSTDMDNLVNTIVGQIGSVGTLTLAEGAISPGDILGGVDFTGRSENSSAPMAFLNAFVFDQFFNQINLLSVQITTAAVEDGSGSGSHELMQLPTINITEPGYVYIYLSNEQATLEAGAPIEVYFDDFKVSQTHSQIVSKDDYYPFGLSFNRYDRPAMTAQNFKYNGKEEISELGLNWKDYGARMYDVNLGRFGSIDPLSELYQHNGTYIYAINNPIRFIDINGEGPGDKVAGSDGGANIADSQVGYALLLQIRAAQKNFASIFVGFIRSGGPHSPIIVRKETVVAVDEYGNPFLYESGPFVQGRAAAMGLGLLEGVGGYAGLLSPSNVTGFLARSGGQGQLVSYGRNLFRDGTGNTLDYFVKSGASDEVWTGSARLVDKILELDFNVPSGLKNQGIGTEMFEDALNAFGDNVQGIKGLWLNGDNLKAFNDALKSGVNAVDAAFSTATGKWAKKNGFTNIEWVNSNVNEDGTVEAIELIFKR